MSETYSLIDLRLLWVLSPITTAFTWGMLIYTEPSLRDYPWRF
ncbi:hypothetical protein [cf. Phormidesmis sp. LEGE 11477]|nr:hypothetical protein [cf. Phormidesmis sp. LEGE 11477]